jgi:predicted nucleic acid-binding protein
LILYLDASALVKRYVDEDGSDALLEAMTPDSIWSMCRFGYTETWKAVARAGELDDVKRMEREWTLFDVVEVTQALVERAGGLALSAGLRTLDALHLAAALSLTPEKPLFATWDARLHCAAREHGLRTLPATLT